MGRWTQAKYNAVIDAMQCRDHARQALEEGKQAGLATVPHILRLEADLAAAEDNLSQAKDAISTIGRGFIDGIAKQQQGRPAR